MNEREFERYIGVMTERDELQERIAQLEAANQRLRHYYEAAEEWRSLIARFHCIGLPDEDEWQRITGAVTDAAYLVEALATDHGLPLPGAGEGADDDAEFGYCDMCGEPLLFASISTCASCVYELQS